MLPIRLSIWIVAIIYRYWIFGTGSRGRALVHLRSIIMPSIVRYFIGWIHMDGGTRRSMFKRASHRRVRLAWDSIWYTQEHFFVQTACHFASKSGPTHCPSGLWIVSMAVLRSNLHPLVVIFILGEKFKLYIRLLFFFEKKNIGFFSLLANNLKRF